MTKTIDNNLEESRWLKKINKTAKPFGERYIGIGFQDYKNRSLGCGPGTKEAIFQSV